MQRSRNRQASALPAEAAPRHERSAIRADLASRRDREPRGSDRSRVAARGLPFVLRSVRPVDPRVLGARRAARQRARGAQRLPLRQLVPGGPRGAARRPSARCRCVVPDDARRWCTRASRARSITSCRSSTTTASSGASCSGRSCRAELKEPPPSLLASIRPSTRERARLALTEMPRVRPETAERIAAHLRGVLDLILFSGHRAHLTSTMHLATVRENYRELAEKNARLQEAYDKLKELDRLKSTSSPPSATSCARRSRRSSATRRCCRRASPAS